MSGKIRKVFLLCFFCMCDFTLAQDLNKQVIDEKSEKPILIGYSNKEAFRDSSFGWWFNSTYENYSLNKDTLDLIKPYIKNYDITIVMGTWCSDSRREVPRFFKILDTLGYDYNRLKTINVDREKKDITGEVENLNMKLVPTFIFYYQGREIGRIVEFPKGILEGDIWYIVKEPFTKI